MWSASMFSQSALFQVNKRRDLAKNTLEQFERSPIISYQSWSTKELFSAIRSFGLLNLDGEIKVRGRGFFIKKFFWESVGILYRLESRNCGFHGSMLKIYVNNYNLTLVHPLGAENHAGIGLANPN
ncbi:unnamed protein product [Meloidogyne enterolobii]